MTGEVRGRRLRGMAPPAENAGGSATVADVVCMCVAMLATLSVASFVGAIFLPLVLVASGGYLILQGFRASSEHAEPQHPEWLTQRETALATALHAKTVEGGGHVLVVREGSDAQGSDYTTADASAAAQTLADAFRGAFEATGRPIKVDAAGRFLRFCSSERRQSGEVAMLRQLLREIKAADVAPGQVFQPIGPGKVQLAVGDRIYTIVSRSSSSHSLDLTGAAPETLPLVEHEFPLHGRMPILLAVDRGRLTSLKDYYGEQVAYYFEFVYFYNNMMVWPTYGGVIVHLYSYVAGDHNVLLPLYATFMMFWATLLTEFWKQTQAELAFDWETQAGGAFDDVSEDRPQFRGAPEKDVVTGKKVYVDRGKLLWLPLWVWRSTFSYTITLVMLSISATGVLWTLTINDWQDRLPEIAQPSVALLPEMVTLQVPGVLQVVWLTVVGEIYTAVAKKLNDFENHKTENDYQDHLIVKRFCFEFVQWLFGLFYTAFWTQDREELSALLFGAMVTRQIVRHAKEMILPFVQSWREQRANSKEEPNGTAAEESAAPAASTTKERAPDLSAMQKAIQREYELEEYSEFDDFLDMALQFAHLTMFSSAMPLAAFCAWANNVFEQRTDMYKLCAFSQRTFPHAAVGIGSWLWTFEAISVAAVLTNVALIGWTTPWFDETMESVFGYEEPLKPHHKLLVLVLIEHILLCAKGLVVAVVPDVPEKVATELRRRQWVAEEAQRRECAKAASGFTRSLQLSRRRHTTAAGSAPAPAAAGNRDAKELPD